MKINYVRKILFISPTSMKAIHCSLEFLLVPLYLNAFNVISEIVYGDMIGKRMPKTVIKPEYINQL